MLQSVLSWPVNVIAPRTLRHFWEIHSRAETPFRDWQKATQKGDFANFNELQAVWPHADLVRAAGNIPVIIFNVGGNKYRLVVNINWTHKGVYIKRILTHAEYDVWNKEGRPA